MNAHPPPHPIREKTSLSQSVICHHLRLRGPQSDQFMEYVDLLELVAARWLHCAAGPRTTIFFDLRVRSQSSHYVVCQFRLALPFRVRKKHLR